MFVVDVCSSPRVLITLTDEDGMPIRGMVKLGSMVKATFSLDPYSSSEWTLITS